MHTAHGYDVGECTYLATTLLAFATSNALWQNSTGPHHIIALPHSATLLPCEVEENASRWTQWSNGGALYYSRRENTYVKLELVCVCVCVCVCVRVRVRACVRACVCVYSLIAREWINKCIPNVACLRPENRERF
jgi:hypothetical protein